MNSTNANPGNAGNEPTNANQPQMREPEIGLAAFATVNAIDGFLAKAPLTRQEQAESQRSIQSLLAHLEQQKKTVDALQKMLGEAQQAAKEAEAKAASLTARVADLETALAKAGKPSGSAVVDAVIENAFGPTKTV